MSAICLDRNVITMPLICQIEGYHQMANRRWYKGHDRSKCHIKPWCEELFQANITMYLEILNIGMMQVLKIFPKWLLLFSQLPFQWFVQNVQI